MATTFGDLDEFFSPGLTLTVRGVEYTLPLPSAELGLWCRRIAQSAGEATAASSDAELAEATARAKARADALPVLPGDLTFEERILGGDVYRQMMADQVPDPYVQFSAQTGYMWIIAGEDAAARYWQAGGRPEAPGPMNRADRRANARKTSTAKASATTSPASGSGTSSPRKSRKSGPAMRTPGPTS